MDFHSSELHPELSVYECARARIAVAILCGQPPGLSLFLELNDPKKMQTNNHTPHNLNQAPELMTFNAYNGLDRITLPLESIRCIQARENYMEFTWMDQGELCSTRLRNTLYVIEQNKKIESQQQEISNFKSRISKLESKN